MAGRGPWPAQPLPGQRRETQRLPRGKPTTISGRDLGPQGQVAVLAGASGGGLNQ